MTMTIEAQQPADDAAALNTRRRGPRVLVVGAGFGGIEAARALAKAAPTARVLIIDRNNFHTFTPLLYQVATAALDPEEIAYPVRAIMRGYRRIGFKVAEVTGVDLSARQVRTDRGDEPYDYLVVAAGSTTNFFGVANAPRFSFGLKDVPEALALRNRLLTLFERALEEPSRERRRALLSFVIVGGGPTGVELAGAFAELTRMILAHDYPALDPNDVRIVLIEAADRLLGAFRPKLSRAAVDALEQRGVEVLLQTQVVRVDEQCVALANGSEIPTTLLVWAAGVRAVDLAKALASALGRGDRVPVLPTLQLTGHPEVFVIGDMAELRQGNEVLPMLAPVAMQEGRTAGENIARQIAGQSLKTFRYVDRGTMATIGRSSAVAQIGPLSLTGFIAWVAWLGLHLVELIGFRNKVLVLVNWAWDYLFFERGVRVITAPERREANGGNRQ
jgi:NADH dehydrogenase